MLLDAEMPGMSGFDVLRAMRAEQTLADVPVIFVTSHCEAAFEVAGFEKGAADFIAKPINAALVLAPHLVSLSWGRPPRLLARRALRLTLLVLLGIPFLNFSSTLLVQNHLHLTGTTWKLVTLANPIALLVAWGIVETLALRLPRESLTQVVPASRRSSSSAPTNGTAIPGIAQPIAY